MLYHLYRYKPLISGMKGFYTGLVNRHYGLIRPFNIIIPVRTICHWKPYNYTAQYSFFSQNLPKIIYMLKKIEIDEEHFFVSRAPDL